MKKDNLTKEEKEILKLVEEGELKRIDNYSREIKRYQAIARASSKKTARLNIRIAPVDLFGIKKKAVDEGVPYQTLITSIIHKYVTGQMVIKV